MLIWLKGERERISEHARSAITDRANTLYDSFVSGWEHELKRVKYPSDRSPPFAELIDDLVTEPLGLAFGTYRFASTLPPIHADPFDRMLIAHALHEGLTIVTPDRAIRRYDVPVIW